MITADKKIKQETHAYIYRTEKECPNGKKRYFASVFFMDRSSMYLTNIYATDRAQAFKIAARWFNDCARYISSLTILTLEDED